MLLLACPSGFVIPDDPSDHHNIYINHTISECALSCISPPIFTLKERDIVSTIKTFSCMVSAIFSFCVFSLWIMDKKKRNQIFVVAYGAVLTIGFTGLTISNSFGRERLCRNNSIPIDAHDGVTTCAVEGAVVLYISVFAALCFAMQSMEVFRRVVMQYKLLPPKELYLFILLLMPLIMSVLGLFHNIYGSDRVLGMCHIADEVKGAFVFKTLAVIIGLGLFFAAGILVKLLILIWIPNEKGGVSVSDGATMAGTSLKFLVFSGGYLVSLFLIQTALKVRVDAHEFDQLAIRWGQCALYYFDGTVASYADHCGLHLHRDTSFPVICFLMAWILAGLGFFFIIVNMEGLWLLLSRRFCQSCQSAKVQPVVEYIVRNNDSTSWQNPNSREEHVFADIYEKHMQAARPRIPEFVGHSSHGSGSSSDNVSPRSMRHEGLFAVSTSCTLGDGVQQREINDLSADMSEAGMFSQLGTQGTFKMQTPHTPYSHFVGEGVEAEENERETFDA